MILFRGLEEIILVTCLVISNVSLAALKNYHSSILTINKVDIVNNNLVILPVKQFAKRSETLIGSAADTRYDNDLMFALCSECDHLPQLRSGGLCGRVRQQLREFDSAAVLITSSHFRPSGG